MDRMRGMHWLVLLAAATGLGSSFLFIKLSIGELPPLTIAAVRAVVAAVAVWLFAITAGQWQPTKTTAWKALAVVGLLMGAVPFATIAWGQLYISSALAGTLFATLPLFSVLVSPWIAKDEPLTGRRIGGGLVGVAGVAIVLGPEALLALKAGLWGGGLTLLAALSYGVGTAYARRHRGIPSVVMAVGQMTMATVLLVPAAAIVDGPLAVAAATPRTWAALLALGTLSSAVPMVLLFWLVRRTGAVSASLVPLFMPVAAVLLGGVVLGEPVPWTLIAGLVVLLAASWAITSRSPTPAGQLAPDPSRA